MAIVLRNRVLASLARVVLMLMPSIFVNGCTNITQAATSQNSALANEIVDPMCGDGLACPQTMYPILGDHMRDYDTQVKLGYPSSGKNGSSVWVKGSEKFPIVRITSTRSDEDVVEVRLDSHFYVHLFEGLQNNANYSVKFFSRDRSESRIYRLATMSYAGISSELRESQYSIAFYGCFQPFTVYDLDNKETGLYSPDHNPAFPTRFLKYFQEVLIGENFDNIETQLPNTKLLVGTGDQVYMDAGYEGSASTRSNSHTLSAWTTDEPVPILKRLQLESAQEASEFGVFDMHVKKTYRAFGAFHELNKIFHAMPQVNAWDDHEIRDGWGSHGDEYVGDSLSPKLEMVFRAARSGYIQHQLLAGSANDQLELTLTETVNDGLSGNRSLHQTFTLGKYEGFVLDLRSNRNKNHQSVRLLGEEQKIAFGNWLETQRTKPNQHIVIVSSMPLFLKNNRVVEKAVSARGSLKDDILDGWHSPENSDDRRWLMSMLLDARLDGVRPVFVSGDYHKGAISEIWYGKESDSACTRSGEESKSIFGYEILASGLFHEGLAKGLTGIAFDRAESQRVGQHMERKLRSSNEEEYCIDPHVEISVVRENFGGMTINDHDRKSSDELKLFAGDSQTDSAALFVLEMDWDKIFVSDIEKEYGGFWRYWSMLPFAKDTFRPKGVLRDRSLDVCLLDFRPREGLHCGPTE